MIRVFLAVLLPTVIAVGQEEPAVSTQKIIPVKTFSTDNGNPETIVKILGDQFPGITFSAGMETGSIFARVDGEDADRVARLIKEICDRTNKTLLQRQAQQAAELHRMQQHEEAEWEDTKSNIEILKTYQLQHVSAEEAARGLNALGFDSNSTIAAFGSYLVVRGPASIIDEVSTLLEQVDVRQRTGEFTEGVAVQESDLEEGWKQHPEASQSKLFESAQALTAKLSDRSDSAATQEIRNELMKVVQQQFDVKMEQERRELKQIQRRLGQISQRLEMQQRLADRIVQQRVDQLLSGDEGLLMLKERELAVQNQHSAVMRRDQEHVMEQLQAALQSLRAKELEGGEELKAEQAEQAEFKAILEAKYSALPLAMPETSMTESETGMPKLRDVERERMSVAEPAERAAIFAQAGLDQAITRLEQLMLEQNCSALDKQRMAVDLEFLKALQKRESQRQDGQLTEEEMTLEQARRTLESELRPDSTVKGPMGELGGSASDQKPNSDDAIEDIEIEETKPEVEVEFIQS